MKNCFVLLLWGICSSASWAQDLNRYFAENGVEGSITLFDWQQKKWIKSDVTDAKHETLPASTFKILHSLIALEEQTIHGINDTMKWDGVPKQFKSFTIASWNQDSDLEMAFKNSTVWYYTELAKKIKRKKYKKYLRKTNYGNACIKKGRGDDFWNFGSFAVSPMEQVELLIQLHQEQLPFQVEHQKTVKALMVEMENEKYVLRSKTGWCYDQKDIGWYVGYLETNQNVLFFATRIHKDLTQANKQFSKLRKTITRQILTDLYGIQWQ